MSTIWDRYDKDFHYVYRHDLHSSGKAIKSSEIMLHSQELSEHFQQSHKHIIMLIIIKKKQIKIGWVYYPIS